MNTPQLLPSSSQEITFKSTVLGILLAVLLCASTTYVGLKVGRTISGSIPAAVLSIFILRWFRNTNILEHNIVQTAASAGEVVSAGVIFTMPALIMIGYWDHFSYLETASLVILSGFLGVAFSIPLRRIMIIEKKLPYPEGIATAQVLKAGDAKEGGRMLFLGGTIAALMAILQDVFHIIAGEWQYWRRVGSTIVGGGIEFSPVLLGAGYIVGHSVTIPILCGGLLTWAIGIPLYGLLFGLPHIQSDFPLDAAIHLWKTKFRFIAVGTMVVGGFWSVYNITGSIRNALKTALQSKKDTGIIITAKDQDLPMKYVIILTFSLIVPLYFLFYHIFQKAHFLNDLGSMIIPLFCVLLAISFGFITSCVSAYITGLVGSTCLPTSGITMSALLVFSLMLLALLSSHIDFYAHQDYGLAASGATIIFGAIIAIASSLSSDNMQDLKAGYLVGATPWKQQIMLMVGIVAAGLMITPILQLLYTAYGFGEVLPRPDMNITTTLAAPQATLMATIVKGIFSKTIQWDLVSLGVCLGIIFVIIDQQLQARKSSIQAPVLSIALGMYLPITYIIPLALGGIISYFVERKRGKINEETVNEHGDRLFASGMIAGHALVGVLIAIPLAQGFDFNSISPDVPKEFVSAFGIISFGWLISRLYKIGLKDMLRKY